MTSNIKAKISRKYVGVYHSLQEGRFLGDENASLFLLCVYLGFKEYRLDGVQVDVFNGEDVTIVLTNHQQTVLQGIAVKATGNYQILQNPAAIVSLTEKFAEQGMAILMKKVLQQYVREIEPGQYSLVFPAEHQLEKSLALFIQDEMMKDSPLLAKG